MALSTYYKRGGHPPRARGVTVRSLAGVSIPGQVGWANAGVNYPMYGNDQYGDCTIAAYGHLVQTWTQQNGGIVYDTPPAMDGHGPRRYSVFGSNGGYAPMQSDITSWLQRYSGRGISPAEVLSLAAWWTEHFVAISASGLYTPTMSEIMTMYRGTGDGQVSATTGRSMEEVFQYAAVTGLSHDKHGVQGYKQVGIGAQSVKEAIYYFGGALASFDLPTSADNQRLWRVVTGAGGNPSPDGWHVVPLTGYNSRGLTCITWGKLMQMTWGWYNKYVGEVWTALSEDWIPKYAGTQAPNGLTTDQLTKLIVPTA